MNVFMVVADRLRVAKLRCAPQDEIEKIIISISNQIKIEERASGAFMCSQ